VIETFRVIAEIKAGCTPEAIRHYIGQRRVFRGGT